jgi:hypothetical protein
MTVPAMCGSGNAGLLTAKAWLHAGIVDDVVFVATDLSATPENVLHLPRLGSRSWTRSAGGLRLFQERSRSARWRGVGGFRAVEGNAAAVRADCRPRCRTTLIT